MNLSHIVYKEIPTNDSNIFFCYSCRKQWSGGRILLKKDQNYMVTSLSLNQKAKADVIKYKT